MFHVALTFLLLSKFFIMMMTTTKQTTMMMNWPNSCVSAGTHSQLTDLDTVHRAAHTATDCSRSAERGCKSWDRVGQALLQGRRTCLPIAPHRQYSHDADAAAAEVVAGKLWLASSDYCCLRRHCCCRRRHCCLLLTKHTKLNRTKFLLAPA